MTYGVVYDFADSRAAVHPKEFLAGWAGKLVCDDYSGYKALFAAGVTEVGCLAHARRKFHELWSNHHSALAEEALQLFGALYEVERQVHDVSAEQRRRMRQLQSRFDAICARAGSCARKSDLRSNLTSQATPAGRPQGTAASLHSVRLASGNYVNSAHPASHRFFRAAP